MDISCDGIVIRETLYGENDKIVTFLTAEYGKITVYCRGVKKIGSKNSSAVQLFCASNFDMSKGNDSYYLKSATVNQSFYGVRGNLERMALASYFAEIAATVCSENSDETEMYRLMMNTFYAMSKLRDIPLGKIKAAFEIKTVVINGFMPTLSGCPRCGKVIDDCVGKYGEYAFSLSEGAVICGDCMTEHDKTEILHITEDTVCALKYLICAPQSKMLSFPTDEGQMKALSGLCEYYLMYQTGKKYKTLEFYKSLGIN